MKNKIKDDNIINIFLNPCKWKKKKKILRFDNHHHQVELKNAGNPSYGKYDSPIMRNLEKIEKKNNEKRITI